MYAHVYVQARIHTHTSTHLQRYICVMESISMVGCQNSIVMNGLSSKRAPCWIRFPGHTWQSEAYTQPDRKTFQIILFCSESVFVFFLKKLPKPKSSTIFLVIICWRMQSLQLQKPGDQQPSTGHVPTVAFVNVLMSHCHNGANLALALTMNLRQEHCCL